MKNAEINADRFMGFADVYDNARPHPGNAGQAERQRTYLRAGR